MTAKEAANCVGIGGKPEKANEFLLTASSREIQEFIHNIAAAEYNQAFQRARVALDIRLAEDAARQADSFKQLMDKLIGIADAQRLLAEKLERQTNEVIWLTRALKKLTVVVTILTLVLVAEGGCQFVESRNPPPRASANIQQPNQQSGAHQHDGASSK
jgi:hypothetical protein